MKSTLRIATRKSPLAMWQAEHVKSRLMQEHEGLNVELVTFTTKGDKILDTPLAKIGGKGLFVKELETAILEGDADIAAHSIKDVPMEFPEGLFLSTILEREEPHPGTRRTMRRFCLKHHLQHSDIARRRHCRHL